MTASFFDELVHHQNDPATEEEVYRNLIGSLHFLFHGTLLDIALAVEVLPQYTCKPATFQLKCLHHVFGYLKATSHDILHLDLRSRTLKITKLFCDSDLAEYILNRNLVQDGMRNASVFGFSGITESRNAFLYLL